MTEVVCAYAFHYTCNRLEKIVSVLMGRPDSALFQRPVTKKQAPDYFDIVKEPMDLEQMRNKAVTFK